MWLIVGLVFLWILGLSQLLLPAWGPDKEKDQQVLSEVLPPETHLAQWSSFQWESTGKAMGAVSFF